LTAEVLVLEGVHALPLLVFFALNMRAALSWKFVALLLRLDLLDTPTFWGTFLIFGELFFRFEEEFFHHLENFSSLGLCSWCCADGEVQGHPCICESDPHRGGRSFGNLPGKS